jgi:hypothetical protein
MRPNVGKEKKSTRFGILYKKYKLGILFQLKFPHCIYLREPQIVVIVHIFRVGRREKILNL